MENRKQNIEYRIQEERDQYYIEKEQKNIELVECWTVFAIVWSLCGLALWIGSKII